MADAQLTEDRRGQLDGIVQQMTTNGESDDNIKAVVSDFKQKYASTPQPAAASSLPRVGQRLAPPGTRLRKQQNVEAAQLPPEQQPGYRLGTAATNAGIGAIPMVAGAAAGAVAGPEASVPAYMGASAGGAAIGSAVKQGINALRGQPSQNPIGEGLSDVALQGALPAGVGRAGEALANLPVGAMAKGAIKGALAKPKVSPYSLMGPAAIGELLGRIAGVPYLGGTIGAATRYGVPMVRGAAKGAADAYRMAGAGADFIGPTELAAQELGPTELAPRALGPTRPAGWSGMPQGAPPPPPNASPIPGQLTSGRVPGGIQNQQPVPWKENLLPPEVKVQPQFEPAYNVEGGTPAQTAPKEAYQKAARTVKGRALAKWLNINGVTAEQASAEDFPWEQVAKDAGVNKPSPDSVAIALQELRGMKVPLSSLPPRVNIAGQ